MLKFEWWCCLFGAYSTYTYVGKSSSKKMRVWWVFSWSESEIEDEVPLKFPPLQWINSLHGILWDLLTVLSPSPSSWKLLNMSINPHHPTTHTRRNHIFQEKTRRFGVDRFIFWVSSSVCFQDYPKHVLQHLLQEGLFHGISKLWNFHINICRNSFILTN